MSSDRQEAQDVLRLREELGSLKKALEEAESRARQYLANWQRTQADLENYRKRMEIEKVAMARYASGKVMASVLPVLDDLERALGSVSPRLAGLTWVDGIRLIHLRLKGTLESQGLTEIEAQGADFNPVVHEAVLYGEGEEGKVVDVIQRGYRLQDRVLRPALVCLGKGTKAADGEARTG